VLRSACSPRPWRCRSGHATRRGTCCGVEPDLSLSDFRSRVEELGFVTAPAANGGPPAWGPPQRRRRRLRTTLRRTGSPSYTEPMRRTPSPAPLPARTGRWLGWGRTRNRRSGPSRGENRRTPRTPNASWRCPLATSRRLGRAALEAPKTRVREPPEDERGLPHSCSGCEPPIRRQGQLKGRRKSG